MVSDHNKHEFAPNPNRRRCSCTRKKSRMFSSHETSLRSDGKIASEENMLEINRLHRQRNITGRERVCNSDTTEEVSMCQGSRQRQRRHPPPHHHHHHRMTLRSNSVICQPHRQHGWLMDWEGMRDTGSGNPFIFICCRHDPAYLPRAPADNSADTRNGAAARDDGEWRQ